MMQPARLLRFGHVGMLASLLLSACAIALGYFYYQGLSLAAQVSAHIMLIVLPAIFKISYLVRLTALKQLGRPVN